MLQQHRAYVRAIISPEPLLGDGVVIVDLALDQSPDIVQLHRVRKLQRSLNAQQALLIAGTLPLRRLLPLEEELSVPPLPDHIGVEARDGHLAVGPVPAEGQHFNIENLGGGGQPHLNGAALQEGADLSHLLRGHLGDDLQLTLRLSHRRACGRGGLDPPEPAGIGHHHALDVFQDVPADIDLHPHRHTAQQFPGHRRGIGHRDRLCTPHGGQQLFL